MHNSASHLFQNLLSLETDVPIESWLHKLELSLPVRLLVLALH